MTNSSPSVKPQSWHVRETTGKNGPAWEVVNDQTGRVANEEQFPSQKAAQDRCELLNRLFGDDAPQKNGAERGPQSILGE